MQSKLDKAAQVAERIGQAVLRERERLELRQDELALAAGVSARVIHQIENGKATSRLDSLVAVLDAVGLSLIIKGESDSRIEGAES